jgi:hypothetical protein
LDESKLTPKQRKWLEASRKIGPGAMTRTERETLDRLYADMLPTEQQELKTYIEKHFGEKEKKESEEKEMEDPTKRMEKKQWTPPSRALKTALSKVQVVKRTRSEDQD